MFPEDFFGQPNIGENSKVVSKRHDKVEHPKLLDPRNSKNKKKNININSIREEKQEESVVNTQNEENTEANSNNKKPKSNLNEEAEPSTSGSSKAHLSPLRINKNENFYTCDYEEEKNNNIKQNEIKCLDKNDNTIVNNEDLFKVTPHFLNEKSNKKKNRKDIINLTRPLTPNLNLIRKIPNSLNHNKFFIIKSNKIKSNNSTKNHIENSGQLNNIIDPHKESDSVKISIKAINKYLGVIRTEENTKNKKSLSSSKIKIVKELNSLNINNKNKNKKEHIYDSKSNSSNINNYNKNKLKYKAKVKSQRNYSVNKSLLKAKESGNNLIPRRAQRTSSIAASKRETIQINGSKIKKKKNISRQKQNEGNIGIMKPFNSENKIKVVHLKVNNEINSLFSNLSDNVAKDPEIHNKIELLIKDIKGIQQAVNRKTQTYFRPKRSDNIK